MAEQLSNECAEIQSALLDIRTRIAEIESSGAQRQLETVYQALVQREAWLRREWLRRGCDAGSPWTHGKGSMG
jgi:hypothetical protein